MNIKIITGRYLCRVPPLGGHPQSPWSPPRGPGCPRGLEKNAKLPNKYIKKLRASKYPKL